MNANSKLKSAAEEFGFDTVMEMLEAAVMDSVCPAICTNPDCDYTMELEPDGDGGFCEDCGTHTVQSVLMIAGLI